MAHRLFESLMSEITALQVQKKNPHRVNIYLDGEFAFGLDRMVAGWLQVGHTLDEEKIRDLQTEDALARAMKQALLFLSFRTRSEGEIRGNLRKHEFSEATIDATIERLRSGGLVDDAQFAQAWVENRNTFRPRGRRALSQELRQKGVDEAVIQSAIEALDEESLAYQAAQQKARKLKTLEKDAFRRKVSDFLARRGFTYSLIATTVSRLWEEMGETRVQQSIDNEEIA
jgi:regulatory protein